MKKTIFFLKNILFRSTAVKISCQLTNNSKLTTDELNEVALAKLKKIFVHAKNNVPYYKHAFKNINVDDINSLKDWEKIPVLTKQDIRDNTDDLIADGISAKRLRKVTTGGSTGVPLTLYHDKNFPLEVIGWRALKWWGIDPSDDIAFIYRKVRTGWRAKLNSLMWYPTRRLFLDASLMTEESMGAFYKDITRIKPSILQGYVGGVFEFAKFCQKNNLELDFLKAIWVTSSPLAEPSRKLMETVFNAPAYDQYGCSEVYWLAAECSKKEGLHVFSDARHIEILDDYNVQVPFDEYGEIAITDLENYSFPLIRYKNGDRGRYLNHSCSCGLPFPLMDKIKGRVTDTIKLQSNKVIAGDYLTTIFDDFPGAVEEFQVYQYKDYSICLFCVLGAMDNAKDICNQKVDALKKLMSDEIPVELKVVDKIKHDQGKTRFFISEVK